MDERELKRVLELHARFVLGIEGGACADLSDTNLSGADLSDTNLSGADLRGADLRGADLSDTNLSGADLSDTNLSGADLRGADLRGADLKGADLSSVYYNEYTAFFALQCPEEGAFIGHKQCRDMRIVKLLIPEDAKRSSATTRKCRASKAEVLEITDASDPSKKYDVAVSKHDTNFHYRVGETVEVANYDTDRWNECAPGIHFFLTRDEAVRY